MTDDVRRAVPASVRSPVRPKQPSHGLTRWLLEKRVQPSGRASLERHARQHPWWQVMCLTGVDYFSTLSYLPGIAVLAAGALSPLATFSIVLLTVGGVLPIYRRVARESPDGQGSVAMIERLMSFWRGKMFILVLLGFVATAWLITITLSSADATVHLLQNPYLPAALQGAQVEITVALLLVLGAVFMMGFTEAVVIAVPLVVAFLALNAVVVVIALHEIVTRPSTVAGWTDAVTSGGGGLGGALVAVVVAFPLLALGMSGFETGVSMMPLVAADGESAQDAQRGRIRNTRRLLTVAALTMSVYLIATSFVTTVLIPPKEFESGGAANGRALAYLAHQQLGDGFGTVYDASTILILWFAGASAMAGLINIVPRYLPRYGMAPDWARSVRPVVLVYTALAVAITLAFGADVHAQSGAYATGILAMMLSAAVAVTLSAVGASRRRAVGAGVVSAVLAYGLVAVVVSKPDGIVLAAIFVAGIVVVSLVSRVSRTTELRADRIEFDETARRFVADSLAHDDALHVVAHRRGKGDRTEYAAKEAAQREMNPVPRRADILILEVDVIDPSDFSDVLAITGVTVDNYRILRAESPAEPNAIAAILLALRDATGVRPHCHFEWSEGNPLGLLLRYLLFGHGDTAPVVREILREQEPEPAKRPGIHVGG